MMNHVSYSLQHHGLLVRFGNEGLRYKQQAWSLMEIATGHIHNQGKCNKNPK
jgi:hypothetical protein